ncbi:MAG: DUF2796 domain-containing protein [Paraglaciecola sp.]|uniref:ZrgA family zinc uptake protein n=1 Tax=Paraglaciecola sp. TaxID=1920173 RepID=UPI0032968567
MNKYTVLSVTLFALAFPTVAQQHVHGQGKMLIAQQDNTWHVQFVLPAINVLGFEHKPETQEQHKLVSEITTKFMNHTSVLELNGDCTLTHTENSLTEHESHDDNEHDAENEHHSEEEHSSHQHGDIEVEYIYSCQSKVTQMSVTLFTWINSLTSIEAQWILDKGQGLTVLNHDDPVVAWL